MRALSAAARPAFTLIDGMATIGVILVIVGLTMPTMTRVRSHARELRCAAQLASHMQVAFVYAIDSCDSWPYAFEHARIAPRWPGMEQIPSEGGHPDWYEAVAGLWHLPVLDAYDDNPFHESLLCPADPRARELHDLLMPAADGDESRIRATLRYQFSMAMFYAPEALHPDRPIRSPALYVAGRVGDVQLPADKAALYDVEPVHDSAFARSGIRDLDRSYRFNVAAADGSVATRRSDTFVPGVVFPGIAPLTQDGLAWAQEAAKLHHTPYGLRGRDW